ncbi:UNVERIFIED_CONTAM: hypothetical protein K2H54_058055 [Gekko kuhli]
MDRNYPLAPAFPDPLASAAAVASSQPATAWAYERGAGSIKPRGSPGFRIDFSDVLRGGVGESSPISMG